MSNKSKQSHWRSIKCPFFHGDNFNSIVCEGCIQGSSIRQTFACVQDRVEWEQDYCNRIDSYPNCPIHLLAKDKY